METKMTKNRLTRIKNFKKEADNIEEFLEFVSSQSQLNEEDIINMALIHDNSSKTKPKKAIKKSLKKQ